MPSGGIDSGSNPGEPKVTTNASTSKIGNHPLFADQVELMNLITKLKGDEMNVVMVTHDLTFAARYCDEIILMEKGKIVDAGPTPEVLTKENIRKIFDIEARGIR